MKFTAPLKSDSIKIMLLGSGELGKEVVIEAQRLGIEMPKRRKINEGETFNRGTGKKVFCKNCGKEFDGE